MIFPLSIPKSDHNYFSLHFLNCCWKSQIIFVYIVKDKNMFSLKNQMISKAISDALQKKAQIEEKYMFCWKDFSSLIQLQNLMIQRNLEDHLIEYFSE